MRPNRNKDKRKRPNEEASVVIDLTKEPDEPTTKKSKTDDHNKRQSQRCHHPCPLTKANAATDSAHQQKSKLMPFPPINKIQSCR